VNHDITNVLSGAKGAATVAAGTVGIGIAEKLDLINGVLAIVSLSIGIIIGIIVLMTKIIELKLAESKKDESE
jgi:hypothetical protein